MYNRFFDTQANQKKLYPDEQLVSAIRQRDSTLVSQILDDKTMLARIEKNRMYLPGERGSVRPLNLLLENHDFRNAGKLIAAGSEITYTDVVYCLDSEGYPDQDFRPVNVLDSITMLHDELCELLGGVLGLEKDLHIDYKPTKIDRYTLLYDLKQALKSKDFITAGQLIAQGADLVTHSKELERNPTVGYPSYDDVSTSVFKGVTFSLQNLKQLAQGLTGIDYSAENKSKPISCKY